MRSPGYRRFLTCLRGLALLVIGAPLLSVPLVAFDNWYNGAWPYTNPPAQYGGLPASLVTNTSRYTNAAPSLTNSGNIASTNLFCPTSGVWNAYVTRSDTWVKVDLPALPSNTSLRITLSNLCVTTRSVTNTDHGTNYISTHVFSNRIYCASVTASNYAFSDVASHLDVTISSNFCIGDTGTNWCLGTNNTFYSNTPPCSVATFTTSTVTRLMLCSTIASWSNPPLAALCSAWPSNSVSVNCYLTSFPQLISSVYLSPTNANEATQCLRLEQTWVYDDVIAAGERAAVLNATVPFADVNANVLNQTLLIAAKARLLAAFGNYAVKELADSNGTFRTWCSTIQSNHLFRDFAGRLNVTNCIGYNANGSCERVDLGKNLVGWYTNFTARQPPKWPPPIVLTNNPKTDAWTYPLTPEVPTVEETALYLLNLPYDCEYRDLTNSAAVQGWFIGVTNETTNVTFVVRNRVVLSSWFRSSPYKVYATPPSTNPASWGQGLGHVVTNTWEFKDKWLWWGAYATNGFLVNGTLYAPSTPNIVTNLNHIATNQLAIAGDPVLRFSMEFYWTNTLHHHSELYSNSMEWTKQVLTLTNWQTVATNAYRSNFVFAANCSTNVFTTNVITGGITNTLTNVETTCYFTNTATMKMEVLRHDFSGQTNAAIVVDPPLANANTTLLSVTLTNPANLTNSSSVFTNYDIATGKHEADYGWDGVKKGWNSLTKPYQVVTNFWQSSTNTMANRYGSDDVADLVDVSLFGYFLPGACVASNSLAAANSLNSFTNAYTSNPPSGIALASKANNLSCGYFRTDVYTTDGTGFVTGIATGSYVVTCLHCQAPIWFDTGNPCDGGNPCTGYEPIPVVCSNGTCWMLLVDGYCNDWATNTINTCADVAAAKTAIANSLGCEFGTPHDFIWYHPDGTEWPVFDGSPGFVDDPMLTLRFWRGLSPINIDASCITNDVLYCTKLTWTNTASDVADAVGTYYGTNPAAASALSQDLLVQQQSSAGIFTDISKLYAAGIQVYPQGVKPPAPSETGRWLLTNSEPVEVSISITATQVVQTWVANTNACPAYAAPSWGNGKSTYISTVTTWPVYTVADEFEQADSDLGSWQDNGVTNFNVAVTNLLWTAAPQWAAEAPVLYDEAHNVGLWGTSNTWNSTGQTNIHVVTDFLNTNGLIAVTTNETLKGWKLSPTVIIISDFSFPHRP